MDNAPKKGVRADSLFYIYFHSAMIKLMGRQLYLYLNIKIIKRGAGGQFILYIFHSAMMKLMRAATLFYIFSCGNENIGAGGILF